MKKLFYLIPFLTLFVACQKDNSVYESGYISFTNHLVAELTRADNTITSANLNAFDVWAHNEGGVVFNATRVEKQDALWVCSEQKEWEHQKNYHFHAFAPSGLLSDIGAYPNSSSVKGLSDFVYVNEGNADLLYAYATRTQGSLRKINAEPVQLTFKHLLSHVKVTFKNDLSAKENIAILETKLTNAIKSAQLKIDDNCFWEPQSEGVFNFGNTATIQQGQRKTTSDVVFLFPTESRSYNIEFNLVYDSEPIETKVAVLNNVTFEMGASYNIVITINDDVLQNEKFNIEFVVEVEEWSDCVDLDATVTDVENGDNSGDDNNGGGNQDENGGDDNGSQDGDNQEGNQGGDENEGNNNQGSTTSGSGYENAYAYVDLGLPSGLKWATCNVGADYPEDYGDYFAWGETEPKTNYSWSTYKYGTGEDQLTKYCDNDWHGKDGFTDDKTVLDLEDDAAHVNWGGAWRMPTNAEQNELRTKCTWTRTKQNGVNGYIVTGPNGNSIFLPAAGYKGGSSLYDAGTYGCYWSSSLGANYPYNGIYMYFTSDNKGSSNQYRYCGCSVRAVCE
ncbi:MAG: fimbrillin family protein [Paludibacteraceae bacterium]|nr:fimbrillin family protein [Paludibacteraceae bacterium]